MPATVIVGAQWGDEGKGKIVDLLAQEFDLVCRYQGGPNATPSSSTARLFKFRHLLGHSLRKLSVLGAGCVVDPGVLLEEIDDLESRGIARAAPDLGNAHLIMPWHIAIDGAGERRLGKLQIGTTRRGIGPAYADKASRLGIRVRDLLDPKILRQKIETALAEKNVWLERVYEHEPFELEQVASTHERFAQRLRPYVADTSLLVDTALREDKRVLLEGAQGTLLDLDHGTYPFVTSSNLVAGAAATGIGIGPTRIDEVVGVSKAYVTSAPAAGRCRARWTTSSPRRCAVWAGVRTVTGRERRPGWLDLVALRYAVRLNGITELALMKLDVLGLRRAEGLRAAYRLPDGTETPDFPAHQSDFHHAEPVLEPVSGWGEPLDGCATIGDLPDAARAYIELVERALEVPVTLVGTGAAREQVLAPSSAAARDPPNLVTRSRQCETGSRAARRSRCRPRRGRSRHARSGRPSRGPRRTRRRARPGGRRPGSARSRRTPRRARRPDPRRARLELLPAGLPLCRSSPGSVAMTRSCAGSVSCKPAQ